MTKCTPSSPSSENPSAAPGGNLTGINFLTGELAAKQLELLRALVPAATRVAVLVNPAKAAITENTLKDVEPAAHAIGLQIQVLQGVLNTLPSAESLRHRRTVAVTA